MKVNSVHLVVQTETKNDDFLTCAYSSSVCPALLWRFVATTPGLKKIKIKKSKNYRLGLCIANTNSFCTGYIEEEIKFNYTTIVWMRRYTLT